jgi:hypothetical protein
LHGARVPAVNGATNDSLVTIPCSVRHRTDLSCRSRQSFDIADHPRAKPPGGRLGPGKHVHSCRAFIPENRTMNKLSRILIVLLFALPLGFVAGCASTETRERQAVGEYIDDSVITAKVKTAIARDPDVSALEVSVETYDGVVQLSGFVSNQAQANRAVEIARGVSGVKNVRNDMRIR